MAEPTVSDREKARAIAQEHVPEHVWPLHHQTLFAQVQAALAAVRAETVEQAREWLENTVSVGVGYQMEKALANHGDTNV
jgi:hypothetical protein